jgi:hypothetical protein
MSPSRTVQSRAIREPVQLPEPEHDVARALRDVMHAFRTIMEGEMRSRGASLSFAHAMLLKALAREPGLSGAQAARRTQVTAQTMNVLLRNLESVGYAADRLQQLLQKCATALHAVQDGKAPATTRSAA